MRHLLGIKGMSREEILLLLNNAQSIAEVSERELKKVPILRGKLVVNLFLEPSTRTRSSFEIAAKRLSADTINISSSDSSVVKGETLLDTAQTIESMAPDILVLRHRESGAAHFLANHLKRTAVVNAGDGMHEHPTQALLDCLTIREHFSKIDRELQGLKVAIVGDVRHSRVARSNLWAHKLLGNEVRLVGPSTLIGDGLSELAVQLGASVYHELRSGISGCDVIICLRLQTERQTEHFIPSLEEYSREFGINERVLKAVAPQSIILHPGPVNRGVEISSEVVDGPRSLVARQVTHGVAVRMAVLHLLASAVESQEATEL